MRARPIALTALVLAAWSQLAPSSAERALSFAQRSWVGLPSFGVLAEQVSEPAPAIRPVVDPLLGSINRDRQERGLEILGWHPKLAAAAQAVADRVGEVGADAVDIPGLIEQEVEKRGYVIGELQLGFGQMEGRPTEVMTAWRRGAPATFEALLAPNLRHFALGLGFEYGVPSYVMVAAVSQGDALAAAAHGLKDVRGVRGQVLERVNRARRENRLKPYRASAALDRVAQDYAEDMWRRGYYGHDSPEGENVRDRVAKAQILTSRVGENVASGQPSADEVMDGWLNSPPHRANILHRRFSALGTGVAAGFREDGSYEIRWVQVFAKLDD